MNVIENLELLEGMLPQDKASILLVHGGLKPSAQVVIQGKPFYSSKDIIHIEPRILKMLYAILLELKLPYETTIDIMEAHSSDSSSKSQEVMRIYIAQNERIARQLKIAFDDIHENHLAAGALLGYPETAVKAFLTPNMLEWDRHPISTAEVSERNMRILGHRLSKQSWRDEVKYLEISGNYIKSLSPKIYKEITKK